MPTVKISACAVAHLLQQQPSQTYNCTELNIQVSVRPSSPSLQVCQLQLVSLFDPMSCSYELKIAISSTDNHTAYFHLDSTHTDAYSTVLTWPTEKPYPLFIDGYHYVSPSNADEIADMPFFPQSSRIPRPLYLMRNTLILHSIFPELSHLCAWAIQLYPAQLPLPLGNNGIPPGINVCHILVAPLRPPHSPIITGTQLLPLSELFPPDFLSPPDDPQLRSSPSQILQKIKQTIHQTQVNSFTCYHCHTPALQHAHLLSVLFHLVLPPPRYWSTLYTLTRPTAHAHAHPHLFLLRSRTPPRQPAKPLL